MTQKNHVKSSDISDSLALLWRDFHYASQAEGFDIA